MLDPCEPLLDSIQCNGIVLLTKVIFKVEEVDDEKPYFKPLETCDMSVFNDDEINVLECVADKMAKQASSTLSEINHKEDAWLKYRHDTKLLVPFSEAFSLKAL